MARIVKKGRDHRASPAGWIGSKIRCFCGCDFIITSTGDFKLLPYRLGSQRTIIVVCPECKQSLYYDGGLTKVSG